MSRAMSPHKVAKEGLSGLHLRSYALADTRRWRTTSARADVLPQLLPFCCTASDRDGDPGASTDLRVSKNQSP